MNRSHSDALVFFGATGDLIYKKIFPALYAMERRGHLKVPVIGVARSDWTIEKFRARALARRRQQPPEPATMLFRGNDIWSCFG
jgi:glucose-6-phosphate 1-dehydrogenase